MQQWRRARARPGYVNVIADRATRVGVHTRTRRASLQPKAMLAGEPTAVQQS